MARWALRRFSALIGSSFSLVFVIITSSSTRQATSFAYTKCLLNDGNNATFIYVFNNGNIDLVRKLDIIDIENYEKYSFN